jgi:hypothetical protein
MLLFSCEQAYSEMNEIGFNLRKRIRLRAHADLRDRK